MEVKDVNRMRKNLKGPDCCHASSGKRETSHHVVLMEVTSFPMSRLLSERNRLVATAKIVTLWDTDQYCVRDYERINRQYQTNIKDAYAY